MFELFESIWGWLAETMHTLGYPGVIGLMTLESSFFPFPSEVVVPPAAAKMNFVLVVAAGIAGSILGALFNYWVAVKLGRPFLVKYGKYVLIGEKALAKSDAFFQKHGEIGTFIGRLLPGIRQVISFPAGLARMNLWRFTLFTALGSGIWVVILAWIGRYIGDEPDLVKEKAKNVLLLLGPALVLLIVGYVVWNWKFRKPEEPAPEPEATE